MADAPKTAKARAEVHALVLRKLGVDDAVARDEGTHFALAMLGGEYRQRLAAWEAGPTLKDAVATLRGIETLSGELARCLDACPAAAMVALDREANLADAYGHEFLRTTLRIRAINRRLDSLGAAAMEEKGRLLNERARLRRRLQQGPRKPRRQAAPEG